MELSEARVQRVVATGAHLARADLVDCELVACDLAGLRGSTLDGLEGVEALRGVSMPYADALGAVEVLARALGIRLTAD